MWHHCTLLTVTTPGPAAVPAPAGTIPGAGDSWEAPRQQHGEAQDRPRPATTRARSHASAGPPSCPGAATLHPGTCSTPKPPAANQQPFAFPMGHPKCFRTWLLGGPSGMCSCMLAGRIGSREGARGALAGRGGRGGQYTHAALPILQLSPGQDGAPCNTGVSVSQLQPVKMLS